MLLSVWTDGLQSNLLSEFVGLVCSIIATYLILDKLIERNRLRHNLPLRRALHKAVGQNLAALSHLWAFTFERANGHDLEEGMKRDIGEVVRDLQGRIEADLQALEASPELRAEFMRRSRVEAAELARETFEDITSIGEVSNRVSQVVLDDIELETMLANLAADATALDHARSFTEYLTSVGKADDAPMDLLLQLSIRCYRGAQNVWNYLDTRKEGNA